MTFIRRRLRCVAKDASGSSAIDLFYYQHQDDEKVPLSDSLGAFDALRRAGKIGAVGLSNFEAPRVAWKAPSVQQGQWPGSAPSALQNLVQACLNASKFRGPAAATSRLGQRTRCSSTDYGARHGFLSGKYRSPEDDLNKSVRGAAQTTICRQPKGPWGARRPARGVGRNRCAVGHGRARLDQGPARRHRADRKRDQPGAGEQLIAALTLDLDPGQSKRSTPPAINRLIAQTML